MLFNKNNLVRKEAVVGIPSEIQTLVDSLSQKVEQSRYPGRVEVGGDISDKVIDFLNYCFSIEDYPDIKDALGLFNRITTARKILDSLSSLEVHWIVNGFDINKSDLWKKRVNEKFKSRSNFQNDRVSVYLRLDSMNNTIVEYEGNLYIGGTYSKPTNDYGTSLRIELELKYALMDTDRFHPSVDPHTTDRFSNLDLDSKKYSMYKKIKKEYKKKTHLPFTSLFKVPKSGEYKELFDLYSDSISVEDIANIVIVSTHGNIIGSVTGIDGLSGDGRKVKPWFEDGGYSTKIELEGLSIYDGLLNKEIRQARLLETIKDEVNSISSSDSSLRTEYDIGVYLYDSNNTLLYSQIGKLSIIKKGRDSYCGRIISQKDMVEKQHPQPLDIDLNRLERNNKALKDIQNTFDDLIKRSDSTSYKIGTEDFNRFVLSFIRDTKDYLLPSSNKDSFSFIGYLDNDKSVDIFSTKSLDSVGDWSSFIKEASSYTYDKHVTEEFVFDFSVVVYLNNKKQKITPILEYSGELSIELDNKTNLNLELKAKKISSEREREYLPKPSIGRYSNLDY